MIFFNMDKHRFFAFLGLLFTLTVSGCGKDGGGEDPLKVELSATPESVIFDHSGGVQSVEVNSNYSWRIEYTTPGWCRPDVLYGSGNATVSVAADANQTSNDRSVSMTLVAQGADKVTINITQSGRPYTGPMPDVNDPDYLAPDNTGMRDLTAGAFAQMMTLGWNLGNSLEALIINDGVYGGGETSWGNAATSKILIDAVKAAGFNTIRIPVAWSHKLVNQETYEVSIVWLNRVEEVVNYALDNEMFVMINVHWDGGWMDAPVYTSQEEINNKLAALWKQIALHFRDYDDQLLFAGTNEVHVKDYYGNPSNENIVVQSSFNQTFVNAVRETGGRNAYRHLIVQAFNTNIDHAYNYFELPVDNVEDKLMMEVHFYDPYDFALQESGIFKTEWGAGFVGGNVSDWGQEEWVNTAFGKMKSKFVDQNIPVIMGEYGAVLRANLTGDALTRHIQARNYYLEYVTRAALTNGIIPVYWDNGHYGNNGFALFNRADGSVVDAEALQALVKGATE